MRRAWQAPAAALGEAAGLLRGWLPADVGLTDLGLHGLNGGGRPMQVSQLAEGPPEALRYGRRTT